MIVPNPLVAVGPECTNTLMPPASGVVPSVVAMGCAVRFCTVTFVVNACVPELYAVALDVSVTYVCCPPRITSSSMPRPARGVAPSHENVPVLTAAWQVIAVMKPPTGAGAVGS